MLYSYIIIWNYKCNYRWPPKLDDLSYKNVQVYIYTKWERSNSKFWLVFFKELTPNSPSPSINKWNDKNLIVQTKLRTSVLWIKWQFESCSVKQIAIKLSHMFPMIKVKITSLRYNSTGGTSLILNHQQYQLYHLLPLGNRNWIYMYTLILCIA